MWLAKFYRKCFASSKLSMNQKASEDILLWNNSYFYYSAPENAILMSKELIYALISRKDFLLSMFI